MDHHLVRLKKQANGLGGPPQTDAGNLLLRALPDDAYALLRPHLRRVDMINGSRLGESGAAIDLVCFPEGGIAGFLNVLPDERRVAVGLLGREGFAGWPALMGNNRWPHEVVARGPDATALEISASHLHEALNASRTLREMLLRYASAFVMQMAETIASNLLQSVTQRTARWLLLYHDRIDCDELAITHDELGAMLGVRRASITDALHQLEGGGSIRGHRGRLLIRDRSALIHLAGSTYGQAEAAYDRLIASSSGGSAL